MTTRLQTGTASTHTVHCRQMGSNCNCLLCLPCINTTAATNTQLRKHPQSHIQPRPPPTLPVTSNPTCDSTAAAMRWSSLTRFLCPVGPFVGTRAFRLGAANGSRLSQSVCAWGGGRPAAAAGISQALVGSAPNPAYRMHSVTRLVHPRCGEKNSCTSCIRRPKQVSSSTCQHHRPSQQQANNPL